MGLFDKNKQIDSHAKEFIQYVKTIGIEQASFELAKKLNEQISSYEIAKQFVLEELDAAQNGNYDAKHFVKNSGFTEIDYSHAMENSSEEVNIPQQSILKICIIFKDDMEFSTKLRIAIVDKIMQEWKLGKYNDEKIKLIFIIQKRYDLKEGIFANINNDLSDFIPSNNDKLVSMAYGYARIIAASGLYLQGVFNKESYSQALISFQSLQLQTDQTVNFQQKAFGQALEYVQSYSEKLTKKVASTLIKSAENEDRVSAYEINKYFTFEQLLNMFNNNDSEIENLFKQLQRLLSKEEVRDALNLSMVRGFIDVNQAVYVDEVTHLINKLSQMTGKTPEELFNQF